MSDHLEPPSSTKQRLSPSLAAGIVGIIAVISPIAIMLTDYGWGDLSAMIISMMWQMNYSSWGQEFRFDPFSLFASLPFTFLRIVFAIMMMRLYQGKTTKKRAILVGIASELQLAVIYYLPTLFMLLFAPSMYFYIQIIIPIPVLFAIGLIIMKFSPPAERTMWIEDEKTGSWWEKSDEEPTQTTEPPKEKTKKQKEPESPW